MDLIRHLSPRNTFEFIRECAPMAAVIMFSSLVYPSGHGSWAISNFTPLLPANPLSIIADNQPTEHATTCAPNALPTTGPAISTNATAKPLNNISATPSSPPSETNQGRGGPSFSTSSNIAGPIIKS